MPESVAAIVEPFVRRGLFTSPEDAVVEMARDYALRQIERYRTAIADLENRYGMTYEQFMAYQQSRADMLLVTHSSQLNQALMIEEEDALEWKIANEMLQSWLGLHSEVKP